MVFVDIAGADQEIARVDAAQFADSLGPFALRIGEVAEERMIGLNRKEFVHVMVR